MIKLAISSPHENKELFFQSSRIVIGREKAPEADVCLHNENITDQHIIIEKINDDFFIINQANDPFATLNGDPFGRRKLQNNDVIALGSTTVRFEIMADDSQAGPVSEENLTKILDSAILSKSIQPTIEANLEALEKELQELEEMAVDPLHAEFSEEDEIIEMDEIEALVQEVEAMEWEEVQALSMQSEKMSYTSPPATSIKPVSPYFYSRENEGEPAPRVFHAGDQPQPETIAPATPTRTYAPASKPVVEETDEAPKSEAPAPPTKSIFSNIHWKWWLILAALTLFLLFLLGGSFAYNMQEKRRIEEIKASQGVADIAMALMYARVNQIKPQNQNWSNPAFLKKNLGAVLSSKYQILATIDAQGQFSNSPYLLRIYPNHDLSQFLVIAQPAPSPLQSLFPRTTIVVDSREMELRKLKDLRELNRLLVNAKTFDTFDAEASSAIIKNGDLIPLTSLTLSDNRLGFCPPRSLAILRPGAENRIYNAPRYYLFGERILNQALAFENDESAHNAVRVLQQDLKELDRLPNLVLYSTTGFTKALHAQKALAGIAPDSQLLVGYLKLNPEGKVISSQLLMKHAVPPSTLRLWKTGESEIAENGTSSSNDSPASPAAASPDFKTNLKIRNELASLSKSREQALLPIAERISTLVAAQSKAPVEDFHQQLKLAVDEFLLANQKENREKAAQLRQFIAQNSDIPMEELLIEIEAAGLRSLLENTKSRKKVNEAALKTEINQYLQSISSSTSLKSLDTTLASASELLTINNVKDPQALVQYQKQLYEAAVQKLSEFLLSPTQHLPAQAFTSSNRPLLDSIFQHAWIKDEDTQDYFLHEFDILSSENHPLHSNSSN